MARRSIAYREGALEDLAGLRAYDRARVVDEIDHQLTDAPTVPTARRKPVAVAGLACWQLRIGEFRVFYRVDSGVVEVLMVRRKGRETTGEIT
jgi:mRNA-degrading endonuclease RelE of RelBE toxin-antitoxin system